MVSQSVKLYTLVVSIHTRVKGVYNITYKQQGMSRLSGTKNHDRSFLRPKIRIFFTHPHPTYLNNPIMGPINYEVI